MRVARPDQQHIKLSFTTHRRDFDLRLHPKNSHYFQKDFELVVDGASQSKSKLLSYDANDPDSNVHGNLAYGLFDGAIHTGDDIYHI